MALARKGNGIWPNWNGLLVNIALAARDAPQSPQIRVSTRLVQFGVIARDKDGPVQDLTKDDFIVLDQGKPRQITVFSIESSESNATQSV